MSQWFPVFLMWKGKPEEHGCVWVTSSGQGHLLAAAGEAWRRGGGCSGEEPPALVVWPSLARAWAALTPGIL